MAIDYHRLLQWKCPEAVQTYTERDTILYALSLGLGSDPTDSMQLPFVYQKHLVAIPTMALVIGDPGFWLEDMACGVNWPHVLYGEIAVDFHQPIKPRGKVVGKTKVDELVDKGSDVGAFLYTTRTVSDQESGGELFTVQSTYICRADGGFGGTARRDPLAPHKCPDRDPDIRCDLPTLPQAALLYRLTGDMNPLHADPEVSKLAGFNRPILHGLCTFGVAGVALLKSLCSYQTDIVRHISARFSKPVFPGETLRTEIWRIANNMAMFRCSVIERDVIVLDNGLFEINQ